MRLNTIAWAALAASGLAAGKIQMTVINNLREVAQAADKFYDGITAFNGNPLEAASLFRSTASIRSLLDRASNSIERETLLLNSRDVAEEDFGIFLDSLSAGAPMVKGKVAVSEEDIEETGFQLANQIVDTFERIVDAVISKKRIIDAIPIIGRRVVRSVLDGLEPSALRLAEATASVASEERQGDAEENVKRIKAAFDKVDAAFQ
ncbi:hypothetical protein CC79DRAFT_84616 [Sarocladium strictum]